jgi:hypothetical protein
MFTFPLALLLALASPPSANLQKALPEGISLSLRLDSVIDSKESHAGDAVIATVLKDAKLGGKVIVPREPLFTAALNS